MRLKDGSARQTVRPQPYRNDESGFLPIICEFATELPGGAASDQAASEAVQLWTIRDRRSAGFRPGQVDVVPVGPARDVEKALGARQRAVFDGIGGKLVDHH